MELGPTELGGRRGALEPPSSPQFRQLLKRETETGIDTAYNYCAAPPNFSDIPRVLCFLDFRQFYLLARGQGKELRKMEKLVFFLEKSQNLHAVFLLQFKIFLPQGVDTVNHGLNKLNFRVSKTMLVGNVIGVSGLATRFTLGSTGLETHTVTPGLQSGYGVLGPSWEVNVDRGAHAGAQVGGARVDVAKFGGNLEVLARFFLDGISDSLDTQGKTLKDTLDITALLHGNDTELILLIDPDQEGLGGIVEDTTTLGPVTLHTSNGQVAVTRDEEEMVINKLLTNSLIHASQRVVVTSQISFQSSEGILHESFNINTLLLGDSGGKTKSLDGTTNTDSARVNRDLGINILGDFGRIHVRGVLEVSSKTMVFADEGIKDIGKVKVGILITSIDTTMLVVEFNGTSNSLGQGEARGGGHMVTQFCPFFGSDVLGGQGVS